MLEGGEATCSAVYPSSYLQLQLLIVNLHLLKSSRTYLQPDMPEMMDDSATSAASPRALYEADAMWPILKATQQQTEKTRAMLKATSSGEEAGVAVRPLSEIIKECIPSESPTSHFRDTLPKRFIEARLIINGRVNHHASRTPQDAWHAIHKVEPSKTSNLILRDIDSDWCKALHTRYPGSMDVKFFLEHIFGLGLQRGPHGLYKTSYADEHWKSRERDERPCVYCRYWRRCRAFQKSYRLPSCSCTTPQTPV